MLKLLDCNNFWSPSGGGVRRYHLEKIDYYKDNPHVSYVFVMHDHLTYTEQIGPNTFIEHLKVPKVWGNWDYRYLIRSGRIAPLIIKHDPDVIEVGSPYFMPRVVNSIVKKNKLKAKVFGFWHADFPVTYIGRFLKGMPFNLEMRGTEWAWKFARKNYNQMNGVLVSSQIILQRMKENGIQNLHFAPLGVDHTLFNPDKKSISLIEKLKAGNPDRLILFFPHRFSKEKGLHLLLEAYSMLCNEMDAEPVLVLAGKGPYEYLVKAAAKRHEHVHDVGFIQSKEEMAAYYASSDLGFALSAWETFGLSIVEALGTGLPLIVAGDGAAKEHILKSDAGFILEETNPRSIADAILKFSQLKDRTGMKKRAMGYAANLGWKDCFDRQLKIYQSAVTG